MYVYEPQTRCPHCGGTKLDRIMQRGYECWLYWCHACKKPLIYLRTIEDVEDKEERI